MTAQLYEFKSTTAAAAKLAAPSQREQLSANFSKLFTTAPTPSEASANKRLPKFGAYGKQIIYGDNGNSFHMAGINIDKLRASRAFTSNAVQLKCEALGLAVYVSSVVQINPSDRSGRTGKKYVRAVVYDHENLEPTETIKAISGPELFDKLHFLLLSKHNSLARDYNLAGFLPQWLALESSHPALIPTIPLNMATQPV